MWIALKSSVVWGDIVGANAVDGVINIITKPAKLTQGAMVTVEAGTEERTAESARYGGKVGDNIYYRAYTKYSDGSLR